MFNGSDTTQVTINSPGRYYLAEAFTYDGATSPKVTIASSDVYLDLNKKSITGPAADSNAIAIGISNNLSNIVIANGIIDGGFTPSTAFTGKAIRIGSNCRYCIFKDLFIQRSGQGFNSNNMTHAVYKDISFENGNALIENAGGSNQRIIRNIGESSGLTCFTVPAYSQQIFFYDCCISEQASADFMEIDGFDIVVENCSSSRFDDAITLSSTSTNCTIWHNELIGGTRAIQALGSISGKHEITSNNTLGDIDFAMTDCLIAFNSIKGTVTDLSQDSTLGNYNFGSYAGGGSGSANAVSFSEGGVFPSPAPEYWNNLAASH